MMYPGRIFALTPNDPLTVSVTVFVPRPVYTCETVVALVLVVAPSPKSQNRLVISPVELSMKLTFKGLRPLVGVAVKTAAGGAVPMPVTTLVLLPNAERNRTALLKLPALVGANWMVTDADPNP